MEEGPLSTPPINSSPFGKEIKTDCLSRIRGSFQERGLPQETIDILCKGWRDSTHKQYTSYVKRWSSFCSEHNAEETQSSVEFILKFFTHLFDKGYSYSAINTTKSALLTFVKVNNKYSWNTDPLIVRFFKGVFNLKPPTPKYSFSWDVDIVLNYLSKAYPLSDISLKDLTLKAITLIALTSGSRAQSLHLMSTDCMDKNNCRFQFFFKQPLKTSKAGTPHHLIEIRKFENNPKL